MPFRSSLRIAAAIMTAGLIGMTAPATGQIVGTVLDEAGEPLPGAIVVVLGQGELLAEVFSNEAGGFSADVSRSAVQRLSVHYLGYATTLVDGRNLAPESTEVRMTLLPVPLPGIVAHITRDICSERDDPEARALWEAARTRYAGDTGRRGGAISGLYDLSYVQSDRLGSYHPAELRPLDHGWGGLAAGGVRQRALEERVAEWGYAWPREEGDSRGLFTGRMHFHWGYPAFEREQAYHFATSDFGDRHTLHVIGESSGGTEVAYCPIDEDRASIRGRLTIGPDDTFAEARWSIHTPDPFEDAGGEIIFADAFDVAGGRHLISARSIVWRHNGRDPPFPDLPRAYSQLVVVAREWIICMRPDRPAPAVGGSGHVCAR